MKKRILVSSEFLAYTGFSTVSENICELLKNDFDISIVDYSRHHNYVYKINDINYSANDNSEDRFGVEKIIRVIENYDYLLIINDIWNISEILESIKLSGKKIPKIVIYFPIDAEGHFGHWYKHLDIVTHVVTYTEFAKDVIKKAIFRDFQNNFQAMELLNKVSIIPHGLNRKDFFKIENKTEIRRTLFKSDKYDDAYIILNANRNQPRKKLDITMRAFSEYIKEANVKSYLYMHSAIIDSSIDIYNYAKSLGILENLILSCPLDTPKNRPQMNFEQLNMIYNACDVGINTSLGEGWGLCNVEQASVGVPQIVPRHSACQEIFSEKEANFIECDTEFVMDNIMTIGKLCSVKSTAEQMKLLSNIKYREEKADNCIYRYSLPCYSWQKDIKDAWLSLLN